MVLAEAALVDEAGDVVMDSGDEVNVDEPDMPIVEHWLSGIELQNWSDKNSCD